MLYRFCHSAYCWNETFMAHLVARLSAGRHFTAMCTCSRACTPLPVMRSPAPAICTCSALCQSRARSINGRYWRSSIDLHGTQYLTWANPVMIMFRKARGSGTSHSLSINAYVIDRLSVVVLWSSRSCRRLWSTRLLLGSLHEETCPCLRPRPSHSV